MELNLILHVIEALQSFKSVNGLKIFFKKTLKTIQKKSGIFYIHTKVPTILQIEPTNYCNCKCLCCSIHRSKRKRGYMDLYLFKKIIDDASQIGVKRIHLYLHGEPLLHPQIVKMIDYIKSKNLSVDLTTNGMLFTKDKIESILHSGVNNKDIITFSILGYSKEVHERIMKGINHDEVVRNIFYLLKLKEKIKKNRPTIQIAFYTMPENEHEKEQFMKYWRGKVDYLKAYPISKSFSGYKKEVYAEKHRKYSCETLWERMTIFWNGDVTICCSDVDGDHILGNLKDQSITKIWNDQKLLSIKKLHKKKQFQKIPFCYNCDL